MPAKATGPTRHARIELPDDKYQRLKRSAGRFRLGVAAYIRLAVLERVDRDLERIEADERKAIEARPVESIA